MINRSVLALALAVPGVSAQAYRVEDVPLPKSVAPEVGGLAFDANGELIVVLRRHGILIATVDDDPAKFRWRVFAGSSLHNPCGVLALRPGELLVPQMPELTAVVDTDRDGTADLYRAVSAGWGVSGNYHETNGGPVPDGAGNWFVAVGTASHNGPTFRHVRGSFSAIGRRGRNFSAVDYKGWVVKVKPDGTVIPWASGFRANNGIVLGPEGDLFVTDNQGDWRGTSPLYHVVEGGFYGHPSSLVWDADFPEGQDPLLLGIDELQERRTRAAVLFPHGLMCNSPSEPIFDTTGGAFGPFAGQLFVGDIAGARILRVMLEKVDGAWQGACVPFVAGGPMRSGTNRLVFSPDGKSLYVGQTFRGWGGPAEGLQRITFGGRAPFAVQTMSLTERGFRLGFTRAVDEATANKLADWRIRHYHYDYGHRYGSPQRDVTDVAVTRAVVSDAGRTIDLELAAPLVAETVYQLDAKALRSASASPLDHPTLCYTVNRLR